MLRRLLASSRYLIFIAIVGTFIASVALFLFEAMIVVEVVFDVVRHGAITPKAGKAMAVAVIETIGVFLIAIVAYIYLLGHYALIADDTLPH